MKSWRGFTLIEMAIVLMVMAILLTGGLRVVNNLRFQQQRQQNQQVLQTVREALLGFVLQNGRLPCADVDGDGFEDNADGKCNSQQNMPLLSAKPAANFQAKNAVVGGYLPYKQLAVRPNDAYGSRLLYVVSVHFADNPAVYADPSALPKFGNIANMSNSGDCQRPVGAPTTVVQPSFSSCSQGAIKVLSKSGGTEIYDDLPFMVVSTGKNDAKKLKNSSGQTVDNQSKDERENVDNDRTFVLRDYSANPKDYYDDSLMWISGPVLALYLQEAGLLP